MRQRRISEKNKLIDILLAVIKKIKIINYPYCVLCGSTYRLQLGHVFTRSYKSVIFDMDNNFIQCEICNNRHEIDPNPYYDWVRKEIGEERFNALKQKALQTKKWEIYELEELRDELLKRL